MLTEGITTGTAVASGWPFIGVDGAAGLIGGADGGVGTAAIGCEAVDLKKERSLLM
jgi:hypothetical protein